MKTRILCFLILLILSHKTYSNSEDIPYDQYADEIINEFVSEMRKEFGLKCMGSGGSMPYDVESICVMFISHRPTSIEEARQLEVKAIEKLLKLINSHEKIRPFLREYPFTSKRADIAINFKDKTFQPYSNATIARISQVGDELLFRSYDPKTKNYVLLFKEPYEESKKKVLH